MSPCAKCIISKEIGVYATPILQPTTPLAHFTTGLAIYAYLPTNPCRLPQPSPANLIFLSDASGESAVTPITGGGTLQLTHTGPHHLRGLLTWGTGGHGRRHHKTNLPHIVRVWCVVDATVNTHLLLRIPQQLLHKATADSLGTQALILWKALPSLPP